MINIDPQPPTAGRRLELNPHARWGVVVMREFIASGATVDPAGPFTPVTTPGAPTALSGTPGNAQVQLSWTAPADTGGTPITGYRIDTRTGDGSWSSITTGTTATTGPKISSRTGVIWLVASVNSVGAT